MRITDELNVSPWELRIERAARDQRVGRERETRTATIASQLDQSPRDGWIDEYDLPYDQLELLERTRAAEAAQTARQAPRAAGGDTPRAPAAPLAEPVGARVDARPPDTAAPEPQVDLLA